MEKATAVSVVLGVLVVLVVGIAFAVDLSNSPAACYGTWTSCSAAYANNGSSSSASVGKTAYWGAYNLSIPSSASIESVVVRVDFRASRTTGYSNVRVSADGGVSYLAAHSIGGNTAEQTYNIDVTGDTAWTAEKISNANFRTNATCVKIGSGGSPTCYIDWIPVTVTYTPFDFSVSTSPTGAFIPRGTAAYSNVTVTKLGGISQLVNLSLSACPTGASCYLSSYSGHPTFGSFLTVQTSNLTTPGNYSILISGTGDGKLRTATFAVTVY